MNKLVVILIGTLFLTGCAELSKVIDDVKDLVTPTEVPTDTK